MQAENVMQAEKRSLAPALVGGVIGAAVGVGLHVVLATGMFGYQNEAAWFAVIIGILTGLGVRQANRHHMDRSYVRGALAGVIALAAIVGSSFAIREVMKRKEIEAKTGNVAAAAKAKNDVAADDADAAVDADAEATVEPAAADRPAPKPAGAVVGAKPKVGLAEPSPWEFVFMALGGLVAYELGRGVDHSKRIEPMVGEPGEPTPRGTDPSV